MKGTAINTLYESYKDWGRYNYLPFLFHTDEEGAKTKYIKRNVVEKFFGTLKWQIGNQTDNSFWLKAMLAAAAIIEALTAQEWHQCNVATLDYDTWQWIG